VVHVVEDVGPGATDHIASRFGQQVRTGGRTPAKRAMDAAGAVFQRDGLRPTHLFIEFGVAADILSEEEERISVGKVVQRDGANRHADALRSPLLQFAQAVMREEVRRGAVLSAPGSGIELDLHGIPQVTRFNTSPKRETSACAHLKHCTRAFATLRSNQPVTAPASSAQQLALV
jgi:hypothetical protein